ncbi:26S proteasome non-ATPase regulatory subunit 4 [Apostasia shenzhenica]|uniref:26S proteasome non-ATPase regulatory subunit 4 n=1 Tax=Apostasia shenzhenica TaxID=1088818 RepID=A0A2I0A695_9ASPA|nr:26S proteasome non-ATPase regulatory subunit 4 [Apostasia shenzhenica]
MLETIGRKLKKNSVALDVVDFGESDDGKSEKLGALIAAVNNNGNSHIVNIPAGPAALSDTLLSTPIFTGDGDGGSGFAAAAAAAAAGGMSGFEFGVDPNLDPELALALRVSMEEERARQEAAAKKAAEDAAKQEKGGGQASDSQDAAMAEPVTSSTPVTDGKRHDLTDDDTALLQQALAMSMDDARPNSAGVADTDMSDAVAEDQDLAFVVIVKWDINAQIPVPGLPINYPPTNEDDCSHTSLYNFRHFVEFPSAALQMSMHENSKDAASQSDMSKVLEDQSFVSSILNSLPGVDPNDPTVKDLLASLQSQTEKASHYLLDLCTVTKAFHWLIIVSAG